MKRAPHLPLFAQTLGLVLATLIIAQIAAIVVILSLPPRAGLWPVAGGVRHGLLCDPDAALALGTVVLGRPGGQSRN